MPKDEIANIWDRFYQVENLGPVKREDRSRIVNCKENN